MKQGLEIELLRAMAREGVCKGEKTTPEVYPGHPAASSVDSGRNLQAYVAPLATRM